MQLGVLLVVEVRVGELAETVDVEVAAHRLLHDAEEGLLHDCVKVGQEEDDAEDRFGADKDDEGVADDARGGLDGHHAHEQVREDAPVDVPDHQAIDTREDREQEEAPVLPLVAVVDEREAVEEDDCELGVHVARLA